MALAAHVHPPKRWFDVRQHATAIYLLLNTGLGAVTGVAFWILLARVARLPTAEIGLGYAIVSLATTVALVAKSGLDTALVRSVPVADDHEGARLLRFGTLVAVSGVMALSLALFLAASLGLPMPDLHAWGWPLVAAIAVLMVTIALQDAWFIAEGKVALTFRRNLAFSGARVLLPLPIVALAIPQPVPVAWALALMLAALLGMVLARRRPHHDGRRVPRKEFLRSAWRNATSGAAEFLPGLVLVPIVLTVSGATSAGYFGMAWAMATMLFLATGAIGRAAFAEMARQDISVPAAIRKGTFQASIIIVPGAIMIALLAPWLLSMFGSDYAANGTSVLRLLALSAFAVAPSFLYIAVLRAIDRGRAIVVFPLTMMTVLLASAPGMAAAYGIEGVALAWLVTNAPFGMFAAWRLYRMGQEVIPDATLGRGADPQ